jgi:hypothetical protein
MPFTEAFVAVVPDADAARDRAVVATDLYKLFVVLVPTEAEAADVSRALVENDGVRSINLCPGFGHGNVARVAAAVGADVAVSVSRGDGPGAQIMGQALKEAGWL